MSFSPSIELMRQALKLAKRAEGQTSPNPMVGAILERDGQVVAVGYHRRAGRPHAEAEALARAGKRAQGCNLYVTLEPCCHQGRTQPCTDAIIRAGVKRVIASMRDPNPLVSGRGFQRLRRAGIEVIEGVLEREAQALNRYFCTFHEKKRPYIIAKWAMSADGRTSSDTGDSKWITNEKSRRYVHRLRNRVDAIAVGVKTVIMDDPQLNVRLSSQRSKRSEPCRIVFDPLGEIPPSSKILTSGVPEKFILCTTDLISSEKRRQFEDEGYCVWILTRDEKNGYVDLNAAIEKMHKMGILSVLLEGGRMLTGSFFAYNLVDYIMVFMAPRIIGGIDNKSPISGWGVDAVVDGLRIVNPSFHMFDGDVCMEGEVGRS